MGNAEDNLKDISGDEFFDTFNNKKLAFVIRTKLMGRRAGFLNWWTGRINVKYLNGICTQTYKSHFYSYTTLFTKNTSLVGTAVVLVLLIR